MTLQEKEIKSIQVITNAGSITEIVADFKKRGYESEFRREADCLYCIGMDYPITPGSFMVDEYYHFEDTSYTDGDRTLYAISTTQGIKGYLVEASFVYEDNISPEMAEKLKWEYAQPGKI
jgi:hypothetical protein